MDTSVHESAVQDVDVQRERVGTEAGARRSRRAGPILGWVAAGAALLATGYLLGATLSPQRSGDGPVAVDSAEAPGGSTLPEVMSVRGVEYGNSQGNVDYSAAEFLPSGRHIAIIEIDGAVSTYEIATGVQVSTIPAPVGIGRLETGHLSLGREGAFTATASWKGQEHLFRTTTGEALFSTPALEEGWIWGMDLSTDGERLATVVQGDDPRIEIRATSGEVIANYPAPDGTQYVAVAFSPDASLLAATRVLDHDAEPAEDGPAASEVVVWDAATGAQRQVMVTPAIKAEFDAAGERVIATDPELPEATVWDVRTGERLMTLSADSPFETAWFAPDGSAIVTGHSDGTIAMWDAESGAEQLSIPGDGLQRIAHVRISPDGRYLAAVQNNGIVHVHSLRG
ncbi:WD40 repeat domain-containing protein [Agromyces binzhouensis]|uniref:WD40 repeat domain-containing protein n=1 Tax=Agromyces binzhouensis TaxID=1817495 RepID=UPI0036293EF5